MAAPIGFARVTGFHTKFDGDDNLWHAWLRLIIVGPSGLVPKEYITELATWLEISQWVTSILTSVGQSGAYTVQGT